MLDDFGSASVAINKVLCPKHPIGEDRVAAIDRLTHAPALIEEWKASCVRGGAHVALALIAGHHPDANLWQITKGFPETDVDGNLVDHDQV
jgi:hypothetical protein